MHFDTSLLADYSLHQPCFSIHCNFSTEKSVGQNGTAFSVLFKILFLRSCWGTSRTSESAKLTFAKTFLLTQTKRVGWKR